MKSGWRSSTEKKLPVPSSFWKKGLGNYDDLTAHIENLSARFDALSDSIKAAEKRKVRFRRCSSTSRIITTQGKSLSGIVSLNIAKSSLRNTVRKSQFIKRRSKPLTNCRLQNSHPVNLCMRNFISWQSTKSKTTLSTVRSEKRKKNCWLPNGRLKQFWISTGRKNRKKNRRKRKRRTSVKAKSHGLHSSPKGADRRYFLFFDFVDFNHEQFLFYCSLGNDWKSCSHHRQMLFKGDWGCFPNKQICEDCTEGKIEKMSEPVGLHCLPICDFIIRITWF